MSLDKALALGWHSVDAILLTTRPRKRIRMVWAGVGVGWALYWLVAYYIERRYITTRSDYE